ncbi:MAG TPA: O-antigen ligase family protein [Terriglobales bacterium]|nr:O-antigen ligase family protein [Terriglobales bacterium]
MHSRGLKICGFLGYIAACLGLFYLAHSHPAYFSNSAYLGGLIFLQLLLASLWKFRQAFFVFLMIAFVWAGVDLPLKEAWIAGRWVVLAMGSVIGFAIYVRDRRYRFVSFHLVALLCVVIAFFSAMVSAAPWVALLKAASLLILFLYASSGGRLAILGREAQFLRGLLLACEMIVYVTAVAYLLFGLQTWGNPNSLGLVMGVVMCPLLLWGLLVSETRPLRWRRAFVLLLALILLALSLSRASIVAAVVSMVVLCFLLRRHKLLLQGTAVVLCVISGLAILAPSRLDEFRSASSSTLVYKGKREMGLMGSRRTPWQRATQAIGEHPWFGAGFGTIVSGDETQPAVKFASNRTITRESGNSYLAILEWMGLLGVIPFYGIVLFLLARIVRVARWIYFCGDAHYAGLPIMLVLAAGLVNAFFEDWLFAVGYYMCIFFWTLAFALIDLVPVTANAVVQNSDPWPVPVRA